MTSRIYGYALTLTAAAAFAVPASAQQDEDYERIVTIMRACAQIDDVMARVTCYDNNIGARDMPTARRPAAAPAQAPIANSPTGFGADMVRQPESRRRPEQQDEIIARVAEATQLEPGIYLLTLQDGAQWRFVDAAPFSWEPPKSGDRIELERGSLGSVFLTFADQRRLRVRRVR